MASVKHHPKRGHAHHNHHRTWLPLILIGSMCMIGITLVYAKANDAFRAPKETQETQSAEVLTNAYFADLKAAMTAFESERANEPFLQALLTMRVPPEYLAVHVQLVIVADTENYSEQALLELIASLRADNALLY